MSARTPATQVREAVASFLRARELDALVDVSYGQTTDGDDLIDLRPRAAGAAGLTVQTVGTPENYVIYVFVAGEVRPIEIAGPINSNTNPPFRAAEDDLTEILRQIATGEVFDELDIEGHVIGSDVPDKSTATSTDSNGRRRWYQAWS